MYFDSGYISTTYEKQHESVANDDNKNENGENGGNGGNGENGENGGNGENGDNKSHMESSDDEVNNELLRMIKTNNL